MKIKINKLDKLFSLFIRTRSGWKCEKCYRRFTEETRGGLQCSHFYGRRNKAVRWHEENAAALCFACHRYFTENPSEHNDWFKKRLGSKRFTSLKKRARTTFGRMMDENAIENCLKFKLEELDSPSD